MGGAAIQGLTHQGEEGVAPGQACVLYDPSDDERVLGGGFIRSTEAVAV